MTIIGPEKTGTPPPPPPNYAGEAGITIGIITIVLGMFGLFFTSAGASACSNVLVQATEPSCNQYLTLHTMSWVVLGIGALLIIIGVIRKASRP